MHLWMLLALSLVIGCNSAPKKIILISTDPREENWENLFDEFDIRAIHRGVGIHTKWLDVEIGKIGKGIRFDEVRGVDHTNPTKKIWGVKFIRRFYEPFVWRLKSDAIR